MEWSKFKKEFLAIFKIYQNCPHQDIKETILNLIENKYLPLAKELNYIGVQYYFDTLIHQQFPYNKIVLGKKTLELDISFTVDNLTQPSFIQSKIIEISEENCLGLSVKKVSLKPEKKLHKSTLCLLVRTTCHQPALDTYNLIKNITEINHKNITKGIFLREEVIHNQDDPELIYTRKPGYYHKVDTSIRRELLTPTNKTSNITVPIFLAVDILTNPEEQLWSEFNRPVPQYFILQNKTDQYLIDTQGFNYCRYACLIEE